MKNIAFAFFGFTFFALSAQATDPVCGDVNADDVVNVTDIVSTVQHILGEGSLTEETAADADYNCDGAINISDIVRMVHVVLNFDEEGGSPCGCVTGVDIDADEDGVPSNYDCDDDDPNLGLLNFDFDCDGVLSIPRLDTLSAGGWHNCAVTQHGYLNCWGMGLFSVLEIPLDENENPFDDWVMVSAGVFHTCALHETGEVDCWGSGTWNDKGQSDEPDDLDAPWVMVAAGGDHSCGLLLTGELVCWGGNYWGQGDVPVDANSEAYTDWVHVVTGHGHTCGLHESGILDCWGDNDNGQTDVPLEDGLDIYTNWHDMTAMGDHTCGLHADGHLECWGLNLNGQSDVPVNDGASWIAVSAGGWHACGLKADGSVVCWGTTNAEDDFYYGQSEVPETASPWLTIAAGGMHTCGLKADGEVLCWGAGDTWMEFSDPFREHGQSLVPDNLDVRIPIADAPVNETLNCGDVDRMAFKFYMSPVTSGPCGAHYFFEVFDNGDVIQEYQQAMPDAESGECETDYTPHRIPSFQAEALIQNACQDYIDTYTIPCGSTWGQGFYHFLAGDNLVAETGDVSCPNGPMHASTMAMSNLTQSLMEPNTCDTGCSNDADCGEGEYCQGEVGGGTVAKGQCLVIGQTYPGQGEECAGAPSCAEGLVCIGDLMDSSSEIIPECQPEWMVNSFHNNDVIALPGTDGDTEVSTSMTVCGLYTVPHGGILRVDLEHDNGSDLEFTLTNPNGTDIDITMDGNQLVYGTRITPHPPTDESANGVWTLTIKDTTEGNTGFLRGWSLYLESWPD